MKHVSTRTKTVILIAAGVVIALAGCGNKDKQDRDFHTSGSREADQRAETQVAKVQQLRGEPGKDAPAKKSLYDRLGGDAGIDKIVEDWINRAMEDPRVNWSRAGVQQGGFSFRRGRSVEWKGDANAVANMKKHIAQFIKLSTGGPTTYEGRPMKDAHANMRISNANFDAAIGDLKATLDKLAIPTDEQKELLAIVESTRPQVATER